MIRQLRSLSTRASITPTSFVNVYHFGDFKGNPSVLMERFFDAFVYVANWGTRWLMFRLPRCAMDVKRITSYCVGDRASIKTSGKYVILEFISEIEGCDDFEGGEGWLATLIPLRQGILHGDYRTLYLAWLACAQDGQVAEKVVEPPVPPGLRDLSASLRGFAEFLRLDDDLIAAAAKQSDDESAGPPGSEELRRMIRSLAPRRKDDFLLQVIQGKGQEVAATLLSTFRHRSPSESVRTTKRRSVRELLSTAEVISTERRREAMVRAEKERRCRAREQELARTERLEHLERRQSAAWRQVEALINAKQPKKYDEAVSLLRDLCELGAKNGTEREFTTRVVAIRRRHGRKLSFLKRLDRAGIGGRD